MQISRIPLTEKENLERVYAGVKKAADIVSKTMGALGRHVFIQSDGGGIIITKDGANTARMINLEDPVENMGARLVIEAALNTADVAGDGTTSTTVMLESIVRQAKTHIENNTSNPIVLAGQIQAAADKVIEVIEKQSIATSIDDPALFSIATVSANGDEAIAKIVVEAVSAVGENGNMSIIDSPTQETYLEVVSGLRIESGYVSPYFINTPRRTVELVNPVIAITSEDFSRMDQVKDIFEAAIEAKRPLVIFGGNFEGEALASVLYNVQQKVISCCLIRTPSVGSAQQEYMEDLAFITGGRFLSQQKGDDISKIRQDNWLELFGSADKITVYSDRCVIAGGVAGAEDIEEYSAKVEQGLQSEMNIAHRARLEDRVRRLKSGVGVIYVGAQTDSELKERKDRIEDSVLATQSALRGGYQPGGGSAYLEAYHSLPAVDDGTSVLLSAILEPLKVICRNAGIEGPMTMLAAAKTGEGIDVRSRKVVNMIESGIIDPTLVITTAIRNAVKIATIIIKSGGSIYIKQTKE